MSTALEGGAENATYFRAKGVESAHSIDLSALKLVTLNLIKDNLWKP